MQFLFPALTFGFFLVMAPVLIHLINMLRHRRVKWAAMEFLMASYRKSRKWVWLKQLLLLLLRMAAIAAVVAMLAQLTLRDRFEGLFSGAATHHYVLIDDSFSMADREGSDEAFDRALQAVKRIVERASEEETRHKITVIRYSQAARVEGESARGVADVNAAPIDGDIEELLTQVRGSLSVTQLATGPVPALAAVRQILASAPEENALVYIVSDFRRKDWDNSEEIRSLLESIEEEEVAIHLVDCAQAQSQNLALLSLEPGPGVPAAGVPLFAFATVANYGEKPMREIELKYRMITYADVAVADPENATGVAGDWHSHTIDEILPGQKVTERFQVAFSTSGYHVVEAQLEADTVDVDNHRWCVIDFSDGLPVLLVDGSEDGTNAYYLSRALAPNLGEGDSTGGDQRDRGHTGILPEIRPLTYLRDTSPEALARYHVIYLLDVPKLDERTVRNLKAYVEAGGGLAVFLGERADPRAYTELYEEGQGLFPVPLERQASISREAGEREPDFSVVNHPILQVFSGERDTHLRRIHIHKYWQAVEDWEPPADSSIRVLARMQGTRDPLMLEKYYGSGRVAVLLTSLSPDWNNWTDDGTFVVTMLTMQPYLSAGRQAISGRMVGAPLNLEFLASQYGSEVLFMLPTDIPDQTREFSVQAMPRAVAEEPSAPEDSTEAAEDSPAEEEAVVLVATLGDGPLDEQGMRETDYSGVYTAWPIRLDGQFEAIRYSYNVDGQEGQMAVMETSELSEQYGSIDLDIHAAESLEYELDNEAGNNWSQFILFALLGILIGEQALAYSASYHPPKVGGAA